MHHDFAETKAVRDLLNERLNKIPTQKRLQFIPIRHHSPNCARHIETLIKTDQPDAILIEGPSNANHLIPFLAEATPPVAFYAYFVDEKNQWTEDPFPSDAARYRCFYPYADFTPEWIAIKLARQIGAHVRFIDLPYAAILAAARGRPQDMAQHDATLLSDRKMMESNIVQQLIDQSHCRDFNEWWDRFYENDHDPRDTQGYFRDLLALAMLLRYDESAVDAETKAREIFMAGQIQKAVAEYERIFVITGAFHTEAIVRHLDTLPENQEPLTAPDGEQGIFLVPYTLNRLDVANDYAAGLPHCGYYLNVWKFIKQNNPQPHQAAIRQMVIDVANALKQKGEPISFSDVLETVVHSQRLARLRGTSPGRMEILDSIETAFVKGSLDSQRFILESVHHEITSQDAGKLPAGMPVASILADFRNTCENFKLPVSVAEPVIKRLDIYRSERHLRMSQFLHRLEFLQIPYASLLAGPDFVKGRELKRVREIWEIRWSPEAEALLTEHLHYGAHLDDAALNVLIEKLEKDHDGPYVVQLFIYALMMGLHQILQRILAPISEWIQTESDFVKLVDGLRGLALAHSAQNTLETFRILDVSHLIEHTFNHACALIGWFGDTDESRLNHIVDGLIDLNGMVTRNESWANRDIFLKCIEKLHTDQMPARLQGAAAGILICQQVWDHQRATTALQQICHQAYFNAQLLGEYMIGFLPLARHVLIQNNQLIEGMTDVMTEWEEDIFLDTLPAIRLAFTQLTPRETRQLAASIAAYLSKIYRKQTVDDAIVSEDDRLSDFELDMMQELKQQVFEQLKPWGIEPGK